MKERYFVLGLAIVLALALAIPALGGSSNPSATKAASAKKTANKALKKAKAANKAANQAQGTANQALTEAQAKQARIRWAFVNPNGSIGAQSGGISVVSTTPAGQYRLNFGSSVANTAILVTAWDASVPVSSRAALCGGAATPGGFDCGAIGNDTNHVNVRRFDSGGSLTAGGFYIAVIP